MTAFHTTTAVAGRKTSAAFDAFFDSIGAPRDLGFAYVTVMKLGAEIVVLSYNPPELGEYQHYKLIEQLETEARDKIYTGRE